MRLLMDALEMAEAADEAACRESVSQFVAGRNQRWSRGDPFVRRYEQGQEINEGTAQYVEMRCIALMKQVQYDSCLKGLASPLSEDFLSVSMPEYLLENFRMRLTGNSISPGDVSRNRIYPAGSAQGNLLDYFGIDWKPKAQDAGPDFAFAELLRDHFGIAETQMASLIAKAKENYDYEAVLADTDRLIQEYLDGFEQELAAFEAQPGHRMEVDLSSWGLASVEAGHQAPGSRWSKVAHGSCRAITMSMF
jgi:hypothetical protein